MNTGRTILNVLNAINAVVLVVLVLKFLSFFNFLSAIGFIPTVIVLCIIFFTKSWVITRFSEPDPLKANRLTNALYNIGMGLIFVAVIFNMMRWPYVLVIMLLATLCVIVSYILSFILPPSLQEKSENQEILDDIIE